MPPQLPEYHCQDAPAPNVPPDLVKVVEFPEHTGFEVADILVGAVEEVLTEIVTLAQAVVLQVPSALT